MRRIVLLLAAAVVAGWASPGLGEEEFVMEGKAFLVTVWHNGAVRDEGLLVFKRDHYNDESDGQVDVFKNVLICWWFGKGVYDGGEWEEYDFYPPPWSAFLPWDGWYSDTYCPYDDFEGYYYQPGDFVYGWAMPWGTYTECFFCGDRLRMNF